MNETISKIAKLISMRSVLTGSTGFESGSWSKTGNWKELGRFIIGSPIKSLKIVATKAAVMDPVAFTN